MRMGAEISECGLYRYSLTRGWGTIVRRMLFVMLNPSTADATEDDPTIRRCIGFAEREGCGQLEVVNLFALRATDPRALTSAKDPVGPANDAKIVQARNRADIIVAAWGASMPRTTAYRRDRRVKDLLWEHTIHALGFTKTGQPRHPLYVRADAPLVVLHAPDARKSQEIVPVPPQEARRSGEVHS
jgi:hypothetical protein